MLKDSKLDPWVMSPIDNLPVGFPIRKGKSKRISLSTDNTVMDITGMCMGFRE